MSDIPSSAGLSPGTNNNLHLLFLSLCLDLTVNACTLLSYCGYWKQNFEYSD